MVGHLVKHSEADSTGIVVYQYRRVLYSLWLDVTLYIVQCPNVFRKRGREYPELGPIKQLEVSVHVFD